DRSPRIIAAFIAWRFKLFAIRSVPRLVRQKTRQRPVSLSSRLYSISGLQFSATSNACSRTFSEGFNEEPNARRTGLFVYSLTSWVYGPFVLNKILGENHELGF